MARSNTPASLITALSAPVVRPFMAVFLDYPTGPVRVTSLPVGQVLSIDGQPWQGIGLLGQMSDIEEGAEVRSYGFTLTLSGIPGNWGQYFRGQDVQGRAVHVHLGAVDAEHQVIAHKIIKRGRMDTQDVQAGQTSAVVITCEDVLVDWERARVRRCTDVDHRTRYPTDGFFKYVAAMENMTLPWGRA